MLSYGQVRFTITLNCYSTITYIVFNFDETDTSFETLTVLDQIICTRRQINFQIFRINKLKIGINTTANKLSHLNKLIALEKLNHNKAQFKRFAKSKFLKYGST